MSWLVIGILMVVGLLLGVQLFAIYSAQRMRGRKVQGIPGPLGAAVVSGRPVMAYFFSPSCAACVRQTPVVQRLQKEHPDIFIVNVPEQLSTARAFGVMGTPSIVLIRNGVVEESLIGYQPESRLRSKLSA